MKVFFGSDVEDGENPMEVAADLREKARESCKEEVLRVAQKPTITLTPLIAGVPVSLEPSEPCQS